MKITNMKLADIYPYDKNPRFNDEAVEAVANSIKEFGWRSPIVVDKDHVIICGHTRFKAAQRLGLDVVPVHVADNLTPDFPTTIPGFHGKENPRRNARMRRGIKHVVTRWPSTA
ncbi:MAG: ParB N-terminal domain-containing protein [Lentisphaeria bacterium]|nr:ParB N-terminal domain-containing protein [Lentisphaeria bacterium]